MSTTRKRRIVKRAGLVLVAVGLLPWFYLLLYFVDCWNSHPGGASFPIVGNVRLPDVPNWVFEPIHGYIGEDLPGSAELETAGVWCKFQGQESWGRLHALLLRRRPKQFKSGHYRPPAQQTSGLNPIGRAGRVRGSPHVTRKIQSVNVRGAVGRWVSSSRVKVVASWVGRSVATGPRSVIASSVDRGKVAEGQRDVIPCFPFDPLSLCPSFQLHASTTPLR